MAFHADAQCPTFALRVLFKTLLGQIQLGQQAVGNRQQILARLGQAQAAALAQPDIRTQLLLQLLHRVAKGGLRPAQDFRCGRKRAMLIHRLDNRETNSLKYDCP